VDFQPQPLDVVIMAAGATVLLAIVIRRGLWSPHALVSYLMAAATGIVIVGMGVDFYRYFLPLLVVLSVCAGVGIGALWSAATSVSIPVASGRGDQAR
jgi:hypothetical protein